MKRENLQKFRENNNLTQEQMARELNFTVAHYKAVEYGIPVSNLWKDLKLNFQNAV